MQQVEVEKQSLGIYFSEVDDGPLLTREQEIELAKTVDAARYRHPTDPDDPLYSTWDDELGRYRFNESKYSKVAGKISFKKIWSDEVDPVTLRRAKRARDKMITANLRLVAKIAKRYQGRGCDLEDLIQEGNMGLIRGIDGYDYKRTHKDEVTGKVSNIKLSTYCTAWIHQRINRLIQNQSRTVRIPVHVQTLSTKLSKLIDEYTTIHGAPPTVEHLLEQVNEGIKGTKQSAKTRDAIIQALNCPSMHTVSLGKSNRYTDNGDTLHNCIADENNKGFEESIFRQEMIEAVRITMAKLTPREEKIARLRFGITEDPTRHDLYPITEKEIEELKSRAGQDG